MASRTTIRAGGVVLLRETKKERQTLLIHRPHHDDWSLPKGKVNEGERTLLAAARECHEETGIRPTLGPPLGRQRYQVMGRSKTVDYWAAWVGDDLGFRPNDEVDRVRWVNQKDAERLLSYSRDVKTMKRAFALPPTTPLLIVRHASATKRSSFSGSDNNRPLSRRGERQAQKLTDVLAAYGIESLVSSPAARCADTLRPFAESAKLKLKLESAFNEPEHESKPKRTQRSARALVRRKEAIAICSHRPVLPDILKAVADLSGLDTRLASAPLKPTSLIVAHRARHKGKWTIVATERHAIA